MNHYVNWAWYIGSFSAITDEAEFNWLLPAAERRFDALTARRAQNLDETDWRMQHVKDAVCALLEYQKAVADNGLSNGVSSVSNAGYSESYKDTGAAFVHENERSLIMGYLSGTGLCGAL